MGDVADGDEYRGTLYWMSTYTYLTVMEVVTTVNACSLSLDTAVTIVKDRMFGADGGAGSVAWDVGQDAEDPAG